MCFEIVTFLYGCDFYTFVNMSVKSFFAFFSLKWPFARGYKVDVIAKLLFYGNNLAIK